MNKPVVLLVLLFCFPAFFRAQNVCSGLDGVDIYRNNKLIATWTQSETLTLHSSLTKPDTLRFHAWTSMESLKNATIDVMDSAEEIVAHLYSSNNTGYEADFTYILEMAAFEDIKAKSLDVFFNLVCDRDIHPQQIAALSLEKK